MTSLEVRVSDTVKVCDTWQEVEKVVVEAVGNWFNSNDENPLILELRREKGRDPPALGVVTEDIIKVGEGLV